MARRILMAGNWKMNGLRQDAGWSAELAQRVTTPPVQTDIALCPL